jgi:hypothetical protein
MYCLNALARPYLKYRGVIVMSAIGGHATHAHIWQTVRERGECGRGPRGGGVALHGEQVVTKFRTQRFLRVELAQLPRDYQGKYCRAW